MIGSRLGGEAAFVASVAAGDLALADLLPENWSRAELARSRSCAHRLHQSEGVDRRVPALDLRRLKLFRRHTVAERTGRRLAGVRPLLEALGQVHRVPHQAVLQAILGPEKGGGHPAAREPDAQAKRREALGPGAILGERAVLDGSQRTATLRAVTPVKVARASADQVDTNALPEVSRGHRREDG